MNMTSRKSLYAIHALVCIAGSSSETVQVNWISKTKKIPRKFLEVIMLELKNAEILGSRLGKRGGYYLRRDPAEISILEIINIIDGGFLITPCLSVHSEKNCPTCLNDDCLLKNKFNDVVTGTQRILSSCSVIDLVKALKAPDDIMLPQAKQNNKL
jgi:Rrf2 family protein